MSHQDPSIERAGGLLTTGDMARLSQNTLRTVRFYEEAGILRPAKRSGGGHRLFDQRELERLQFVTDMRAAGLSLEEIRQLLELKSSSASGAAAATAVLGRLDEQIHALEDKIDTFIRLREELLRARSVLHGCQGCSDSHKFPEDCDTCTVITERSEVPKGVRVLWGVGANGADSRSKSEA